MQVIAHGLFPRLLGAPGSSVRWCAGKNVAVAFPSTYQTHLSPVPCHSQFTVAAMAAWEALTVALEKGGARQASGVGPGEE